MVGAPAAQLRCEGDKQCRPMQQLAGKDGAFCHNTPACHRLLVEFRCLLGPNLRGGGEGYSYPVHNNWCHAVVCLIMRLISFICWALPGWPLVGHLGNIIFYNTMWVAHACILSMLLSVAIICRYRVCNVCDGCSHLSSCPWCMSCGGPRRYWVCGVRSGQPLKDGNHDFHLGVWGHFL